MKICKLTPKEQAILALLKVRSGPVSAQEIYEQVWGERYFASSQNVVAVHIAHLRRKRKGAIRIKTIWGRGYLLDEEESK